MSARPAKVTQSQLERAIRAIKSSGLGVVKVVASADGYAIETSASVSAPADNGQGKPKPVL